MREPVLFLSFPQICVNSLKSTQGRGILNLLRNVHKYHEGTAETVNSSGGKSTQNLLLVLQK